MCPRGSLAMRTPFLIKGRSCQDTAVARVHCTHEWEPIFGKLKEKHPEPRNILSEALLEGPAEEYDDALADVIM